MEPLEIFYLVMAKSMTVGEAAQRYGRSQRTIRRWFAGGPHRNLSLPLADLYALGDRRALADFLGGKPAR